jgi:hypothetical protein
MATMIIECNLMEYHAIEAEVPHSSPGLPNIFANYSSVLIKWVIDYV